MTTQSPTDFLAFDDVRNKLLLLSQAFKDAVRRVVNADNEQFNTDLDSFEANIVEIIKCGTIGEALEILFNSFDLVGQTALDQFILSTQLFDFGDDDTITVLSPKQSLNKQAINASVQIDSLALAFSNATRIEFSNESELSGIIDQLNDQYNKVIQDNIDSDTRISLLDLKTVAFSFFSQLDLKSLIDIETSTIPSTVLAYQYYKDSARSDEIVSLNNIQNTGFIEGPLKIVST